MALTGIALGDWRARGRTFDFRGQPIAYWTAGASDAEPWLAGFIAALRG